VPRAGDSRGARDALLVGMATRAERFKSDEQLKQRRPRASKSKKHFPGETLTPDGPAKKRGVGHTATRNVSVHAQKKATFALDDSATTPPRKSTRKSANRSKADSNLRRREQRSDHSPEVKAAKSNVPAEKPKPRRVGKSRAN
jgi:hypothetical protein